MSKYWYKAELINDFLPFSENLARCSYKIWCLQWRYVFRQLCIINGVSYKHRGSSRGLVVKLLDIPTVIHVSGREFGQNSPKSPEDSHFTGGQVRALWVRELTTLEGFTVMKTRGWLLRMADVIVFLMVSTCLIRSVHSQGSTYVLAYYN